MRGLMWNCGRLWNIGDKMQKINEILLIIFTVLLIIAGLLYNVSHEYQYKKEDASIFFMNKIQILNQYWEMGICKNYSRSPEGYKKYIDTETGYLMDDIEFYSQPIKTYTLYANILLVIAIIGHVLIIFIESFNKKRSKKPIKSSP